LDRPLIGVHHIEGHIAANYLENKELEPPFICLVASGGHSHIVHVQSYSNFEILGQTRDDAAGEAFDKIARAIGLGYPGGPQIDKAAVTGNREAISFPRVSFPGDSLDFSFSGLKTAVLNYLNGLEQKGGKIVIEDVCASFQQAVVDVLVKNTMQAAARYNVPVIALAGGVASNSGLRQGMKQAAEKQGIKVCYPRPVLCTDNAAMIASAAFYDFTAGRRSGLELNAIPGLRLGDR
jgi:N6-L-threonylcarbamoyladenine synthase